MGQVIEFNKDNEREVDYTLFPNQYAMSYKSRTKTWSQLCHGITHTVGLASKGDAQFIKLARFNGKQTDKNSYRHDAGVEAVSGIECDYDDEELSFEAAVKLLNEAGVSCFVYTSASYTEATPRWRVLAPFRTEYCDSQERMKAYRSVMIRRLEGVLGIRFATESHTLSQAYYFGGVTGKDYKTSRISGEYITERFDLDVVGVDEETPLETFQRVNRAALVSDILTEKAYHTSLRSLAAGMAHDGHDYKTIETFLMGVMDAVPSKGTKWQARKDSIGGLIRSALRKFGDGTGDPDEIKNALGGVPITRLGMDASKEHNPFSFIVDGLMPAAVMGITGAGGSAKSTIVLWTMLHIITGRTVFGKEVIRTGSCVFVSAEDERDMITHRVVRMCEAMGLSEEETDLVASRLYIEDVSGTVCRLVESKRDGNLSFSDTLQAMVDLYKDKGVVFIAFDPATYFGAGERFVNDGEALLMSAGRRISKALGCCTAFVHHVGKQSGRDKTLDQYAGRGGSAFADNARAMWSMARYERGDKNVGAIPEDIQDMIDEGCDISRLVVTKMSYGSKPKETLWIGRDKHNAWEFHPYWSSPADVVRTVSDNKAEGDRINSEIIGLICNEIIKQRSTGEFPNYRSLRSAEIFHDTKKVSAHKISSLIHLGIVQGRIVEEPLPDHLVRGARKTYLEVTLSSRTNSVPIGSDSDDSLV